MTIRVVRAEKKRRRLLNSTRFLWILGASVFAVFLYQIRIVWIYPIEESSVEHPHRNPKTAWSDFSSPKSLPLAANQTNSLFEFPSSSKLSSLVRRKWAYAYLVGGCRSRSPEYRGFLYNVMAARRRLLDWGSEADVVLMIQMSVHTREKELPISEADALRKLGIRLIYLPKFAHPVHEVFYSLVQNKFRILEWHSEYSRVLFLDADLLPECNLDYLFELSEPLPGIKPVLKENLVLSSKSEAAHAAIFMLQPAEGDFELLQKVIQDREEKALHLPWPHWDEVEGWGRPIEPPDFWRSSRIENGTLWNWHAVFADQGLLYYWTKYIKQSVSIVVHDAVDDWSSRDGKLFLERTHLQGVLNNYTCVAANKKGVFNPPSPYRDFVHFSGRGKPWEKAIYQLHHSWKGGNQTNHKIEHSSQQVEGTGAEIGFNCGRRCKQKAIEWYATLESISSSMNIKFNFSFAEGPLDEEDKMPVGRFSDYEQMYQHIRAKARRNWDHFQGPDTPIYGKVD